MIKHSKFHFVCKKCGEKIKTFPIWFEAGQVCPKCGHNRVDTVYSTDVNRLVSLIQKKDSYPQSLWYYLDFLPLNHKGNIISSNEGVAPIDEWQFLEDFAMEKYDIECEVFAFRSDLNTATGTFKDSGATLAASVLTENNVDQYVVASTGNTATAFANYFAKAGISLSVFIPEESVFQNENEISSYGQRVFRVKGDYAKTKKIAAEYAKKNNIIMTGGNYDPLRIEAKKTMVFEWLRQLGEMPTVYIQALSGGTGPLAIEKAFKELEETELADTLPRMILTQPSECAPMAHAWQKAKAKGFPVGFEKDYPIYENPKTKVPTLATGDPKTYPAIAKLVKQSKGEIIEFDEELMVDVARVVAYETTIKIGPASAVAVGGFFEALKNGLIKNGDKVMINIGEGVNRAADFLDEISYTSVEVNSVDDCKPFDRKELKELVWQNLV